MTQWKHPLIEATEYTRGCHGWLSLRPPLTDAALNLERYGATGVQVVPEAEHGQRGTVVLSGQACQLRYIIEHHLSDANGCIRQRFGVHGPV
jgi:hypothetical protein